MAFEPVLLGGAPVRSLDEWLAADGMQGLARALHEGPAWAVDEVTRAGVRGRGGAGFLAGRKWRSVADSPAEAGERYVVVNGAEGEPGTFKDRAILRHNPYQVLEGALIAAAAVGAVGIHVAIRASCELELVAVEQAAAEMAEAGHTQQLPIEVFAGPEHYLFGEEKGLLSAIEGDEPLPRWLPPYLHGLFATGPQLGWSAGPRRDDPAVPHSHPTVVNNVETLAAVAHVARRGAAWFRSMGTEGSPGSVVCTVVGDTARAGVGEVEMGTPLGAVIEELGGGMPPGREVKAVLSGVANPAVGPEALRAPVSYEGLESVGGGLGAAGFIVYDDTTSMVEVAEMVSRFLWVESCGQCPACKRESGEITEDIIRIVSGGGTEGTVERIGSALRRVTEGNRCYLAVQEQVVIASLLRTFPDDFVEALEAPGLARRGLPLPLVADLADGEAVWDVSHSTKRADWTHVGDR